MEIQRTWFLEGLAEPDGAVWRTEVRPLPFRVGRRAEANLRVQGDRVSGLHAELFLKGDALWLRDTGSTNGTWVNGERVEGQRPLAEGDVLHFADQEFRLVLYDALSGFRTTRIVEASDLVGIQLAGALQEMLRQDEARVALQPLVRLADGGVVGYEVLGRGSLSGEGEETTELFRLADSVGVASQLSDLYRRQGLAEAGHLPAECLFFLNTHPREMLKPRQLLASLEALRRAHPRRLLVLEVHEAAVTDSKRLNLLTGGLRQLGVEVAFDDFGAGQDRLMALAETSPSFLKFDIGLIRDLDRASPRRREMVRRLVRLVRELKIAPLAEGIESETVLEHCRELGFELGQGYLLGRPVAPVEAAGGQGKGAAGAEGRSG